MNITQPITNISKALVEAHKGFKPVACSGRNPHLKSSYSTLGDYLNAVRGALLANNIVITQSVSKADVGIAVKTRLTHSSGEWIESEACVLPVEKGTAQAVGSAISYARRYSLAAFLGISSGIDDDDGVAASKAATVRQSPAEAAKLAKAAKPIDESVPF